MDLSHRRNRWGSSRAYAIPTWDSSPADKPRSKLLPIAIGAVVALVLVGGGLVWFFNNYSVSFGGSSDVTATSSVVPPKNSELPVPQDAGVSDIQHTINLAVEHAVADFGGQASIAGARFKGGWGTDESGGYMARQMGRVPQAGVDGCVGVAVLARPADGTYSTAQQMLNSMVRDISGVLEGSDTAAG